MQKRNGFTLIELSIVLVIIGIIAGMAMKGTDLISSAKHKKIYNNWLKKWELACNEYQDKTGYVLADGDSSAPHDNGGTNSTNDGVMDYTHLYDKTTVQDRLKAVGIEVPTSNLPATNGGKYRLNGQYDTQNTYLFLSGVYSRIDKRTNNSCIIIGSLPTDIAIEWDKMTDGQTDPQKGNFRIYPDDKSSTWGDASVTKSVTATYCLD